MSKPPPPPTEPHVHYVLAEQAAAARDIHEALVHALLACTPPEVYNRARESWRAQLQVADDQEQP